MTPKTQPVLCHPESVRVYKTKSGCIFTQGFFLFSLLKVSVSN